MLLPVAAPLSSRVVVRAVLPLAAVLVAGGCAGGGPREEREEPPAEDVVVTRPGGEDPEVDPAVLRFVRADHPKAWVEVRWSQPARGVVLFAAHVPLEPYGDSFRRDGVRFGERIGWIGEEPERERRRRAFRFGRGDAYLFSAEFAAGAREAGVGWPHPFADSMAANPATPRETLALLVAEEPRLHARLLEHPRVREDVGLLAAIRRAGAVGPGDWRAAALPALERALRDPGARGEVLALLLETLGWGPPRPDLAEALVAHPGARGDTVLLLGAARLGGAGYERARRDAVERLVRLPRTPRAVWMDLPWWETHRHRVRDRRVAGDRAVLRRLRWGADPFRFPGLRAEADRLLLAHPEAEAEDVFEIAAEIAANLRRCRRYDYPSRAHALAALAHPAARADDRVAQALVYAYEVPEVRAAAYRRLTGQPLPPGRERRPAGWTDAAQLLQAHSLAVTRMYRVEGWRDTVRAAMRALPEAEAAGWARLLDENPDDDAVARAVMRRGPEMDALRRRSAFLALLPPEERDDLGVPCEDRS